LVLIPQKEDSLEGNCFEIIKKFGQTLPSLLEATLRTYRRPASCGRAFSWSRPEMLDTTTAYAYTAATMVASGASFSSDALVVDDVLGSRF
jgi:hypothetical protein